MKKITLSILLLVILILSAYKFFHRTFLKFELVSKADIPQQFLPIAYEFFQSQSEYERFFLRNSDTKKLQKMFSQGRDLNFNDYSYCVFFGKEVSQLFYSMKTTYFDDPSPSYASCRKKGKKCVFASYVPDTTSKGVYLYCVPKDAQLSGFDGL